MGTVEKHAEKDSRPSPDEFNENDVAPELYDLEAENDTDVLSRNLSRVMSKPNNLERLESLSRVLSSRRLSQASGGFGSLAIDPDDFDLNILLKTLRARFDEKGIIVKQCGVAWNNLTANGIDASAAYGDSVSEIFHGIINLPSTIRNSRNPPIRHIIHNTHGIVKGGEMLLVLGRPGSGCSSLLKTLAGEVTKFTSIEGDVSYDGATMQDMINNFKSEIVYNPERMYFISLSRF